ncbi:hypothetical protein BLOT_002547 [Blomia tropicalis]|nr:hypothetical protein BLOT_002547 [Blomia tropicalis]
MYINKVKVNRRFTSLLLHIVECTKIYIAFFYIDDMKFHIVLQFDFITIIIYRLRTEQESYLSKWKFQMERFAYH